MFLDALHPGNATTIEPRGSLCISVWFDRCSQRIIFYIGHRCSAAALELYDCKCNKLHTFSTNWPMVRGADLLLNILISRE